MDFEFEEGIFMGKYSCILTLDNEQQKILRLTDDTGEKEFMEVNSIALSEQMQITGILRKNIHDENALIYLERFKGIYKELSDYFGYFKGTLKGAKERYYRLLITHEGSTKLRNEQYSQALSNLVEKLSETYQSTPEFVVDDMKRNVACVNVGRGCRFEIREPYEDSSIIHFDIHADETADYRGLKTASKTLCSLTKQVFNEKLTTFSYERTEGVFNFYITKDIALPFPVQQKRLE